jgi:hypothetical protein
MIRPPDGESGALNRVRLRAVEIALLRRRIVGTPYVFQLCVVIHFARVRYVGHCSRHQRNMSVGLAIFVAVSLASAKISKLFV